MPMSVTQPSAFEYRLIVNFIHSHTFNRKSKSTSDRPVIECFENSAVDLGVKIIIGSGANHNMTNCLKSKLRNIHPKMSQVLTLLKLR
jgi:hypothetical protein